MSTHSRGVYPDNALASALAAVAAGRPVDMCYRPAPDRLTVCTLPRGHEGPHSFSRTTVASS